MDLLPCSSTDHYLHPQAQSNPAQYHYPAPSHDQHLYYYREQQQHQQQQQAMAYQQQLIAASRSLEEDSNLSQRSWTTHFTEVKLESTGARLCQPRATVQQHAQQREPETHPSFDFDQYVQWNQHFGATPPLSASSSSLSSPYDQPEHLPPSILQSFELGQSPASPQYHIQHSPSPRMYHQEHSLLSVACHEPSQDALPRYMASYSVPSEDSCTNQQPIRHSNRLQLAPNVIPRYANSHDRLQQARHIPPFGDCSFVAPTEEARVPPVSLPESSPIATGLTDAQLFEYLFLPHEAILDGPIAVAPIVPSQAHLASALQNTQVQRDATLNTYPQIIGRSLTQSRRRQSSDSTIRAVGSPPVSQTPPLRQRVDSDASKPPHSPSSPLGSPPESHFQPTPTTNQPVLHSPSAPGIPLPIPLEDEDPPKLGPSGIPLETPAHLLTKSEGGKPAMACTFCRGRKIACAPTESNGLRCNQCERRGLECEYPTHWNRGGRKKKTEEEKECDKKSSKGGDCGMSSEDEASEESFDEDGEYEDDGPSQLKRQRRSKASVPKRLSKGKSTKAKGKQHAVDDSDSDSTFEPSPPPSRTTSRPTRLAQRRNVTSAQRSTPSTRTARRNIDQEPYPTPAARPSRAHAKTKATVRSPTLPQEHFESQFPVHPAP